jgi:hypothetical protein
VSTPGQGLELLTRPIVLAVIAELEWGRQAHGLVTNGTTNPKRRTPPEGRARSLGPGAASANVDVYELKTAFSDLRSGTLGAVR